MRRRLASFVIPFVALAAISGGARATSIAEGDCFADWSDAAPVVAQERLLAARDIQDMARRRQLGDLVRITLCRENARYVYRLIVRDGKGRLGNLKIDAKGPLDRLGQP